MQLRTEIKIQSSNFYKLTYQSKILNIGSCFAEMMASKLQKSKFYVLKNPFGTVFNPLSIVKLLQNQSLANDHFVVRDDLVLHLDLHSSLVGNDRETLTRLYNQLQIKFQEEIQKADLIIITLGTAWVYKYKETGQIIANCHKLPNTAFEKKLISIEEIVTAFELLLVNSLAAKTKIILTVSPVRHIKDTLELNSVSKAVLRLVCHTLVSRYPERIAYFPAFEYMIDDLRDYRFYDSDMIHPSPVAEEYIFNQFLEQYVTSDVKNIITKINELNQDLAHKPFNKNSDGYQKHLKKILLKINELEKFELDFSLEKSIVMGQINT
jgi:lysophospholipase L1-like esterase